MERGYHKKKQRITREKALAIELEGGCRLFYTMRKIASSLKTNEMDSPTRQ